MRRTRFLVLILALLAGFGTSRTALAGNALTAMLDCFNGGGGSFVCSAYTSGGTGNYVSYYWQMTDTFWGQPTYNFRWTSSEPYMQMDCRVGAMVTVTVTVTDSQGETGTDTFSRACSQWAD